MAAVYLLGKPSKAPSKMRSVHFPPKDAVVVLFGEYLDLVLWLLLRQGAKSSCRIKPSETTSGGCEDTHPESATPNLRSPVFLRIVMPRLLIRDICKPF